LNAAIAELSLEGGHHVAIGVNEVLAGVENRLAEVTLRRFVFLACANDVAEVLAAVDLVG
jgi:hypothetical protein